MRKKVGLVDTRKIKQNLAMCKSLAESIEGTNVKSKSTAGLIAKRDKADIARIRAEYILQIEQFGAGDENRAKQWAKMSRAKKPYGKSGKMSADWANQEKALKYIDKLKGISGDGGSGSKTQVNIFGVSKGQDNDFIS